MNLRTLLAAAAFLGLSASAAFAQNAYTTGNVNMRAGPSTQYPRVTTIPNGSAVDVHGCTSGWGWCDTSWRGLRGLGSGNYLQMLYNNRRVYLPEYAPRVGVPVITFQFGNYWDRWYRDRPFYRERHRWDDRRPGIDRPRPPRPGAGAPPRPRPDWERPRPPRPDFDRPRPQRPDVDRPRPPRPDLDRPRPPRPGDASNQRPPRPGFDRQRPDRREDRDGPRRPRPDRERGGDRVLWQVQ